MNSKNKYINVMISYLLAISMATSFFTSLRIKYVGISELCFLVLIIILFFKYHKYIFLFNKKNFLNYLKIFLIVLVLFINPILSFTSENINFHHLKFHFSYFFSVILFFLTIEFIKKEKDYFNSTIALYLLIFIFLIIINFLISKIILFENYYFDNNYRFQGLTNNPNQLSFFLIVSMIFIGLLKNRIFYYFIPILVLVGLETDSRAFAYGIYVSFFIFLIIFLKKKFIKNLNMLTLLIFLLSLFIILIISLLILIQSLGSIESLIKLHDNYSDRSLYLRFDQLIFSTQLILKNPFFGIGLGNVLTDEAHNTFLDFAIIFGIPLSLLLLFVLSISLLIAIYKNDYFLAFSLTVFIFFIQFHFVGRHFIFYTLLAFLSNYSLKNLKKIYKSQ